MSDLVNRLRAKQSLYVLNDDTFTEPDKDAVEAADCIESQAARIGELERALRMYVDKDECDVDGAPDTDHSRHSETCLYCRGQAALSGTTPPDGLTVRRVVSDEPRDPGRGGDDDENL